MTEKYIKVEDLQKYCDNQTDHTISPNEFQRMNHCKFGWQTGTPTEIEDDLYWSYNYVLVLNTEYDCIGDYLAGNLFKPNFEEQVFVAILSDRQTIKVPFKDVIAWQRIEPYKED